MTHISTAFRIKTSKNDIKKDGTTAIYLYMNIDNSLKWIRTGKYVKPEHFDNGSGTVKKGNGDSIKMNELLGDFKKEYTQAILQLELKKRPVTHATIKAYLNNRDTDYDEENKDSNDFIAYALKEVENIDTSVSDSHYKTIQAHIKNLKKYQDRIAFKEINSPFLTRYKHYMADKGNKVNSIAGAFRAIRLLINIARKQGETSIRPFESFKIESQETEIQFLKKEELIKLHDLYDAGSLSDRLQNTLHYFLLSCYTGLRKGDISRLNKEHIDGDTLVIMPNKTRKKGKILRIPLSQRAKRLLVSEMESFFKRPLKKSSSRLTTDITEILGSLGITKHITFHGSRHTFAVNGLVLGIPLKVISVLLGHSSVTTTEIYAKVVDELKEMEMKKWDF